MNRSRLSVAAYMLAVFIGGVMVGGFGQRLYTAKAVGRDGPLTKECGRVPQDLR